MKHNLLKKLISVSLMAVYLITATVVSAENSQSVLSQDGYMALDLSLTKTIYSAIGEKGTVKAAVITEKDVTMYASPFYANKSDATSGSYYAAKIEKAENEAGYTFIRESGASKTTFTARPQRTMISASNLTYHSDNTAVATVDANGIITITGYGIANISVTYNALTVQDASDDVRGAVTIFASAADGNIAAATIMPTWADASHSALELRANTVTAASVPEIAEADTERFYPSYIIPAFDPIGDDSAPLTMHVIDHANMSISHNLVSEETKASGSAELISTEYAKGSSVMLQGWYYESGKTAKEADYPRLMFSYAGTQDASSVRYDGRHAFQLGVKASGKFVVWGGDATIQSVTKDYSNYLLKDKNPSDVTDITKVAAEKNNSGVETLIDATKGWHQFALTAEPSMVHTGTDYVLTKVYIDGVLVTAQDIYIGDIPEEKRRINVMAMGIKNATGFATDKKGSAAENYLHYKDLAIVKLSRSEKIVDSIPSNGAQNVPLYQTIKVKLGSAVENANITLNGERVADAKLDKSGTIISTGVKKLRPNTVYTLKAAGEEITFKTTADEGMTNILDDMKTYGYTVTGARSVDFADNNKSAEEYGVEFLRPALNQTSVVSNGVATFEEGERQKQTDAEAPYTGVLIRGVTPYGADAERIVVSYKVKLNVPSSYSGEEEYVFNTNTTGAVLHAGGMGVPIIAKKDESRFYNPVKRAVLSGATGSETISYNSFSGLVPKTQGDKIDFPFLKENAAEGDPATTLDGTKVSNSRLAQTSFTLWRNVVYVIDMDPTGVKPPTWSFIDVNTSSKSLVSENAIYTLSRPAAYGAGYTWVDSIYIPVSRFNSSIKNPTSFSVKDIEIYTLSQDERVNSETLLEVRDCASGNKVESTELSGKSVDITLNGFIPKDSTVVFSVFDTQSENARLEVIKTVKVNSDSESYKLSNFSIPQGIDAQLSVFVWDSVTNKRLYSTKYIYNSTN